MIYVVISCIVFIELRKFTSVPSLLRVFIINEYWFLSDTISTSYWYNYVILSIDMMDCSN